MNTLQELTEYGFAEANAKQMLNAYKSRLHEIHGCIEITDITYVGDGNRDVELKCVHCGAIYHKIFRGSSNKWSEIRRTCPCQSHKNENLTKIVSIFNDDPSYIGKVYGDWKIVGFTKTPNKRKSGNTILWMCECIHCGNAAIKQPGVVRKGVSCSCQAQKKKEEFWKSEIGKKYGRLTVVNIEHKQSGKSKKAYAVCNCDCGGHITCQISALRAGQTKSCGCIEEEWIKEKLGKREVARSRSPLYTTWVGMNGRCFDEHNRSYGNYGGRGITVCDEWRGKEGFDRFEKWSIENGYVPETGLSLDRVDVNGNYEPGNCRYTTIFVQNVNKRPAKRKPINTFNIDGEEKTLNQWCKTYNISTVAVKYRMDKLGMDLETAIKTPKSRKGNIFAGEQAKQRTEKQNAELNKCQSYIEANLYLAFAKLQSQYKLVPQYNIGKYRADFLIDGTNIVVECDGYDQHKTKEQIASDYERDRYLIRNGYIVLRFSGSEINNDPDKCCSEIIEITDIYYANRKANVG